MLLYNQSATFVVEVYEIMKIKRDRIDMELASSGMNYSALAKQMGCSAQNLSVILNRGSCHPATVLKIATALGTSMESLINEVNQK